MSETATNSITNTYYGSCPYRLPCGYCEKIKSPCFYTGFSINGISKITCGTNGATSVSGGGTIEVNYKDNNAVNVINKADSVII